jgi:hypothetical protein
MSNGCGTIVAHLTSFALCTNHKLKDHKNGEISADSVALQCRRRLLAIGSRGVPVYKYRIVNLPLNIYSSSKYQEV